MSLRGRHRPPPAHADDAYDACPVIVSSRGHNRLLIVEDRAKRLAETWLTDSRRPWSQTPAQRRDHPVNWYVSTWDVRYQSVTVDETSPIQSLLEKFTG